jgi:DNA-binding transcriptional MerR regulator
MISDASSMVNVESHVLRYWEDELELNIPRNEMGHRYYTQENIKEFQYIKELKEKGYQLKAIKMIVHNGDMEQRLPELTGNEADKPGGVKNHQVYFVNSAMLKSLLISTLLLHPIAMIVDYVFVFLLTYLLNHHV